MSQPFVTSVPLPGFSLWKKMDARQAPYSFELEVTARCNLACRHCYISLPARDRNSRSRELSLQEIERIAAEAVTLGALWCLITGGEPLLRKDFAEIYLTLKRLGLLVSVFTNASLVTPEVVDLFRQYPPRDIEVTVYGVTPETYERVSRRPGSFAAFRRGLELLHQGGVPVRLKAIAMRANLAEFPEIARFCRERTGDFFRFDPFLQLGFDGNDARNNEICAQRLSPEEIVALEQADPERSAALQKDCGQLVASAGRHPGCNHLFRCGAGLGSFCVSPDGLFRLCPSLWHPDCLYDLRQGSLRQAWENLVPRVRGLRAQNLEFLEKCNSCSLVNLCLWCPARAHLESGRMDAWVEYFCQVAHARARALGYAGKAMGPVFCP